MSNLCHRSSGSVKPWRAWAGVALVATFTAAFAAPFEWPEGIARWPTGVSTSAYRASLSDRIVVQPADASVDAARADFLGRWTGYLCARRACDVRVVVERVGPSGDARLHFALADASIGRSGLGQFVRVLDGSFDGNELGVGFQDRGIVHALRLRLRSRDVMEAVFERTSDRNFRAAGVLLRDGALPPIPPFDGRWPEGIEALRAGKSTAVSKASLLAAPQGASDAPDPKRATWGGDWSGWMCSNRGCDVRVAVRDVTAVSATVHWAMAADGANGATRAASGSVAARFDGDELDASFADGPTPTRLRFRQRGPDELEVLIDGSLDGTPLRAWGVLTR